MPAKQAILRWAREIKKGNEYLSFISQQLSLKKRIFIRATSSCITPEKTSFVLVSKAFLPKICSSLSNGFFMIFRFGPASKKVGHPTAWAFWIPRCFSISNVCVPRTLKEVLCSDNICKNWIKSLDKYFHQSVLSGPKSLAPKLNTIKGFLTVLKRY